MKNRLFIFTPCLPHYSHPVHWNQTEELVYHSLGSRPSQAQELFTLVLHLFGTTTHCLSIHLLFQSLFQLLPPTKVSRRLPLTFPLSHKHQHAQWPIGTAELFPRFYCLTPIGQLCHWTWLRRGYLRYGNLIDWLIDWLIVLCSKIWHIGATLKCPEYMYRSLSEH